MTPDVSVVVPVHNGAAHLAQALDSVLRQAGVRVEVLLLDDGSTDGSRHIIAAYAGSPAVTVLPAHPEPRGAAATWTELLTAGRGRYVKLLCQDDVLAPYALARQAALLDRHPAAALTAGRRRIIDSEGRLLLPRPRGLRGLRGQVDRPTAVRRVVRSGTNLLGEPVAVLVRRDVLALTGGADPLAGYLLDLDLWCRALRHGHLIADPAVVGDFRVSTTQWSCRLAAVQAEQFGAFTYRLQAAGEVSAADCRHGRTRARHLARARRLLYAATGSGRNTVASIPAPRAPLETPTGSPTRA